MPDAALPDPSVFIVTIRRSVRSEPEAYYMPAPTPSIAELRVRRLAKAPDADVLSIHTEFNGGINRARARAGLAATRHLPCSGAIPVLG